ncbi:MAG: hypothetical protein ACW98I_18370 [Candidatus Hodarchaeales archaeon]|jgi:hypothetical protein
MYVFQHALLNGENPVSEFFVTDKYLITLNDMCKFRFRDLDTFEFVDRSFPDPYTIYSQARFNDLLYISDADGKIEGFNLQSFEKEFSTETNIEKPYSLAVSEKYLAISSEEGIDIFDRRTLTREHHLTDYTTDLRYYGRRIFLSDNWLVTEDSMETLLVWDLNNLTNTLHFRPEPCFDFYSLFDNYLIVGKNNCVELDSDPCTIQLWNLKDVTNPITLGGLKDAFYHVFKKRMMNPLNKKVLIGLSASTIDIWEWDTWKPLTRLPNLPWVLSCELMDDTLLVGQGTGGIRLYKWTE